MNKVRNFVSLLCLAVICFIGVNVASADELGPANPVSKTEWDEEDVKRQPLFRASIVKAEAVIADISHHQGTIDWAQASKVLDLAIIRTQDGSTTEDTKHTVNEEAAIKYSVPFGVYANHRA